MSDDYRRRRTDQGEEATFVGAFSAVHRDLGKLEGRMDAVEQTMSDVKQWMIQISNKLTAIQSSVDNSSGTAAGEKTSKDRMWNMLTWLCSTAVALLTVWAMIHYGH
jgi:hypothetical protein